MADAMNAEVKQLMELASRGTPSAQRDLAERFYYGRGVERSIAEAIAWLLLAATNGDDQAKHLLRLLCKRGILKIPVPRKALI